MPTAKSATQPGLSLGNLNDFDPDTDTVAWTSMLQPIDLLGAEEVG